MIVQADASLRGLGACPIQDGKPIAFASKSLTGAESRYANIERELLTIVFACIRFNTYLQGLRFTVQSDHKPLEMIHLKSMHNVPPRLQRMLLQLQKYDMKIEYKPGSEMLLADALSRCPARYSQEIKLDLRVDYIAFTSAWIETLKETTCEDPVLSTVYQLVQHGWPKERRRVPNVAKYYWDFRDELSKDEGLLLKGPSLIIPAALRENYLQRLHEGHLSASKRLPMQGSICFGRGSKLTSKTTREGVRHASRGADQPESRCSLMRFQTDHGKSWAWISSTSKASATFLPVIISRSFLSCLVAKPVGVH